MCVCLCVLYVCALCHIGTVETVFVSFSALPVWKEAEEPKDAVVPEAGFVDKSNPLHAPDSLQPWRNAGYSNLAPEGWTQWEDLPAPYKYYQVKVDPKDVEEPGMLYKLFTKWQTGIPLVTLLALPAFVYDVVLIDERFELMMIFWTTLAVVNASAGDGIKKMFQDQVDEVKTCVSCVHYGLLCGCAARARVCVCLISWRWCSNLLFPHLPFPCDHNNQSAATSPPRKPSTRRPSRKPSTPTRRPCTSRRTWP